jgi:RNA polymerase sigma factor (sigma-70 family)
MHLLMREESMRTTSREQQSEFQRQLEEHSKILYKVCHLYCSNATDREDLQQEILYQMWRSFSQFDGRYRFSTWMYRIALNTAISFVRKESTRKSHFDANGPLLLESAPAPDAESEEVRAMYRIIRNLDPLHRALILLYLDGNSYEEIAAVIGITETNVATKLSRLKSTLKRETAAGQWKAREQTDGNG